MADPTEAPPGAAPAATGTNYIGIPDDFYTQRTVTQRRRGMAMEPGTRGPVVGPTTVRLAPDAAPITDHDYTPGHVIPQAAAEHRYKAGEEYSLIAGLSPESIGSLQRQLVAAGLITSPVKLGAWDSTSAEAYKQVLAIANINGYTADEALQYVSSLPTDVVGGAARAPLQTQLSNPDDLARVFNQTAEAVYGRRLDPTDIDRLVTSFHQNEAQSQQTNYDQQATGGTITAPPSAQAFGEKELQSMNPGLAGATDLANTFDNFTKLIGAAGSG